MKKIIKYVKISNKWYLPSCIKFFFLKVSKSKDSINLLKDKECVKNNHFLYDKIDEMLNDSNNEYFFYYNKEINKNVLKVKTKSYNNLLTDNLIDNLI